MFEHVSREIPIVLDSLHGLVELRNWNEVNTPKMPLQLTRGHHSVKSFPTGDGQINVASNKLRIASRVETLRGEIVNVALRCCSPQKPAQDAMFLGGYRR